MCAARCHRSLKRDEEITLWRSLCALGAPLYGNLCISFFPSLSSLFLSPSLSAPRPSLSTSRSFCCLPLSLCIHLPRRAPPSAAYSRILVLLTCSVKHTRHGISPIPSFSPRIFLSSPCSFFFSLDHPLSLSLSLAHSFPTCSRTSTFAPLPPFSLFSVASG